MILSVFCCTLFPFLYNVTASYQSETIQVNPEQLDVITEEGIEELYEFREEHEGYFRVRFFRCRCNSGGYSLNYRSMNSFQYTYFFSDF